MADNSVYINVLVEALNIIGRPEKWTKEGVFNDPCDGQRDLFSLDCALKIAQKKIKGQYFSRSKEMTAVRKVIFFHYFWRYGIHPIYNFNKHKKTTHKDIVEVLQRAIVKLRS